MRKLVPNCVAKRLTTAGFVAGSCLPGMSKFVVPYTYKRILVVLLMQGPRTSQIGRVGRSISNLVIPYTTGESIWICFGNGQYHGAAIGAARKVGKTNRFPTLDQTTHVKWIPDKLHEINQSKSKQITR